MDKEYRKVGELTSEIVEHLLIEISLIAQMPKANTTLMKIFFSQMKLLLINTLKLKMKQMVIPFHGVVFIPVLKQKNFLNL